MAFPNVPNVPGVPAVPRLATAVAEVVVLLIADIVAGFLDLGLDQWGIFQNGEPVLTPDSFVAFEYKNAWTISDYPIEQGGFESFNKVDSPFDARVQINAGESLENRKALLDEVHAIAGNLELYDIVTPEKTYTSVNISHMDYRRTSTNGVGLLTINLWLTEIRENATATFSQTKTAGGADPVSGGIVQPQEPTADQAGAASSVH